MRPYLRRKPWIKRISWRWWLFAAGVLMGAVLWLD